MLIAGAVALNQRVERRGDARMPRTTGRPLPSGTLTEGQVTWFGLLSSAAGIICLALLADPLLVVLAAASWLVYVGGYTPLKSRSAWQTPVGAVAGAMPVLLGAATAGAPFSPMALSLLGIVYFWQFPHSMAIAWLYRHEFTSAEVKVASVVDPSGRVTGALAFSGTVCLLPVSLAPWILDLAGRGYLACALPLGLAYLALAFALLWRRDDAAARWLLRASLVYLPGLLVALLLW